MFFDPRSSIRSTHPSNLFCFVGVVVVVVVATATKKRSPSLKPMKLSSVFAVFLLLNEAQAFTQSHPHRQPSCALSRASPTCLFDNVLEGRKIGGEVKPVNNFLPCQDCRSQSSDRRWYLAHWICQGCQDSRNSYQCRHGKDT